MVLTATWTLGIYILCPTIYAQIALPNIQIDPSTLEISETGEIKGKIKANHTTETKQYLVKAIGIGQTSIVCFDSAVNKYQVKNSGPFLVTGQTPIQITSQNSQTQTDFLIFLKPSVGNVSCDQLENKISGPTSTFSNVEIALS